MKKIIPIIICLLVITSVIGVGTSLGNSKNSYTQEAIVKIDAKTTTLTKNQIKSLDNGADITLDSEVYRLSKVGDEKVYEHTDGENIFLTKYIAVDSKKRTYRKWEKVNEEVVTKAIMNSVLTDKDNGLAETLKDYVTDEQLTEILTEYEKGSDLTETLKKYVTDEQLNQLNEKLKNYYTKNEISNLLRSYITANGLSSELKNYVGKDGLSPIIENYYIQKGVQLDIELHTMYFVQAFNDSGDIQELKIVGKGNKNGTTGKFAMVITGDSIDENLCILQTGSIIMSNLVVTDSRVTGIAPNGAFKLRVFRISGQGTK